MTALAKSLLGSVALVMVLAQTDWGRVELLAAQPKPALVEADGTIALVSPMGVRITTSTNQVWLFRVNPKTEVQVTGTAEADFLRPGLFIEFTAEVDRKGTATGEVTELTIFAPTMQKFPGLFPAGGFTPQPDPTAKPDPKAPTSYKVMGQITAIKKEQITVNAGRGTVRFDLAADPKIGVEIADPKVALSLMHQGDKIKVRGTSTQDGFGEAQQMEVELAQPLSGAKKKPDRKPDEKPDDGDKPEKPEKPDRKDVKKPSKKGRPGKEEPPEEPKEEPKEEAAQAPGESKQPAAAPQVSERVRKIVSLLQLPPDEAGGRRPAKIAVGGAEAEVFTPARPAPLAAVEPLLGKAQASRTVEGMMAPAEGAEPRFVSLRLLVCDGVKVFVDEQGLVQFYQVTP